MSIGEQLEDMMDDAVANAVLPVNEKCLRSIRKLKEQLEAIDNEDT